MSIIQIANECLNLAATIWITVILANQLPASCILGDEAHFVVQFTGLLWLMVSN